MEDLKFTIITSPVWGFVLYVIYQYIFVGG